MDGKEEPQPVPSVSAQTIAIVEAEAEKKEPVATKHVSNFKPTFRQMAATVRQVDSMFPHSNDASVDHLRTCCCDP